MAGIAQGTFYLYFPSKFAVMPSIAETMVNTILVSLKIAVDLNASIDEQIKKFIQTVLQIYDDNRKHLALIYAGLARNSLHTDRAARLVIGAIESAAEQVYLFDQADDKDIQAQMDEVYIFVLHALRIKVQ